MQDYLTILIAFIALHIAYQQWRINDIRLRHELYDRRLKVYKDCRRILYAGVGANYDTVTQIFDSLTESYFLFRPEVSNYMEELWDRTNVSGQSSTSFRQRAQRCNSSPLCHGGDGHGNTCGRPHPTHSN
jgi:hypothetical protein